MKESLHASNGMSQNFGTVSKQNKNQIILLNLDTTFKPELFAYI